MSIRSYLCTIVALAVVSTYALAAPAPALRNPGFEGAMNGWKPMPTTPGAAVAAVKVRARGGALSLQLKAEEGRNPWIAQGLGDIVPRATYLLTAYVQRGEGAGRGAVKLEFYDAQDNYLGGFYGLEPETPVGDWNPVQVKAEAPENAAKVAIILRMLGGGSVYWDDVSFELVAPAPDFRLSPARVSAPAQAGATVNVTADLALTTYVNGAPEVYVVGGGAETPRKVTATASTGASDRTVNLEVTLPDLAPGFYRLQVGWPKLTPATTELVLLPSGRRPADVGEQGWYLLEGKVFAPVGVFHVAPEEFAAVAEAGFTVAQIAPPTRPEALRAAVEAAQEANLRLLVPLYPGLESRPAAEAMAGLVRQFAAEPTVFAWLLADQPELRADAVGPLTDLYLRVRQVDGNHPCLLTVGPEADLSAWADLCDGLLVQAFPRAEGATALTQRLDEAGDGVRSGQPWTAVLAAGWPGQESPGVEMARSWLYRAIVDGSLGALWFSLREGEWDLTTSPLWPELPRLNAETVELARAFAQGEDLGELEISVKQVGAHAIRLGEQAYLVLLNETAEPVEGAVRVPLVVTGGQYLDGSGEANARSRTIRFTLPPSGARAIRLDLAPAAEQPVELVLPEPEIPVLPDEAGP